LKINKAIARICFFRTDLGPIVFGGAVITFKHGDSRFLFSIERSDRSFSHAQVRFQMLLN
jgi:hypothetical protein